MEDIVDYQESEAYLEAKQYIERIKQENEKSLGVPMKSVGLDVSDHGVSLTVYPVTVPCSPLSYATVQWDAHETPAEPPAPGSDHELDSIDEQGFDWTLNLPSEDLNYIPNQDDNVDLQPEAESQADVRLATSQVCKPNNGRALWFFWLTCSRISNR